MAAPTVRIMEDGPRNTILWVDGVGDSDSVTIISPADLEYVDQARLQRAQFLRVDKIEWDINNADSSGDPAVAGWVELSWEATADYPIYHMVGRSNKYFKDFGGLYPPDATTAPGQTGAINLVTNGIGADDTGGAYTLIIYLVKLLPNP